MHSPEMLKLLDESSEHLSEVFGTPSTKDERINRELTDDEVLVVKYLSRCVAMNKEPVKSPTDTDPTLQDWVACLDRALKVADEWPIMNRQWKNAWET
ncbi:MAG: hypothetical protein HRU38_10840 [Saccharospirillaceae bacterium]|nr:hypothetical protein [Saccharospirillaceae bacterium]